MTAEKTYVAIDLEPTKAELGVSSPLHITVTPPVKIEDGMLGELTDNLREAFHSLHPFDVVGGDTDQFGPHEEPVLVRKIVPTDAIRAVHALALGVMQQTAPDIDTTYAGERYKPHSTFKNGYGLGENERRTVDHLTLLRKVGAEWTRIAQFNLAGTDEATA